MKVSIAIPCYEASGVGYICLKVALGSIAMQTYDNYEIVISDQSKDNLIHEVYKEWENKLPIKYFHNENNIGIPSANMNNCIKNCQGELIKILFMDDFFYSEKSLGKIVSAFNYDKHWLVSAYTHTNDRENLFNPHSPKISNDPLFINAIGTPSCLTIENNNGLEFDENLLWGMDCDYYYQLCEKYGDPKILEDITVVQYLWKGQMSHTLATKEVKLKEFEYLKTKYHRSEACMP